ncbi:MAG: Cupin 2 conserved barrel domain protein [Pseudonocardiales bacterium]|nr:Cupin 2 conserved barrel domain protein [Pseudonocardiales bacterium]
MVAPILRHVSELTAFQLRDGATNKMISLLPPGQDGAATSINLEIFDVAGRQNPNSHPDSAEAFYFLSGNGLAHCDGETVSVGTGDFLILPAGSMHFIENTGPSRLYALTTLLSDDGSHDGSTRPQLQLDPEDVSVIGSADVATKA